jgi:AcrR family transcriptional regulator
LTAIGRDAHNRPVNLTAVQSLRPHIVASALEVLHEHGLEGVTMRAVADRARVTAPALYWHFADKEALIREVGREASRAFKDRMLEANAAANSEARLRRSLEVFRSFAVTYPSYFHMLFVRPPTTKRGEIRDGSASPTIFQLLVDRVGDCMRDGSLAKGDAPSVAMSLAALAQGLVVLHRPGRFASDTAFAAFFDVSIDRMIGGLR